MVEKSTGRVFEHLWQSSGSGLVLAVVSSYQHKEAVQPPCLMSLHWTYVITLPCHYMVFPKTMSQNKSLLPKDVSVSSSCSVIKTTNKVCMQHNLKLVYIRYLIYNVFKQSVVYFSFFITSYNTQKGNKSGNKST